MPLSESKKAANTKWDKENMTTVGCRITKAKAMEFKVACITLDTKPNQVFLKAIDQTIGEAKEKNGQ